MLSGDLGGGTVGLAGGAGKEMNIHIADLCCCTAEMDNIVKQLYSNKKRE